MLLLTHPSPFLTAAPSFDPDSIAGLYAWWKADAISGKADGDRVSSWTDSKSGISLAQASSSAQPLFRTGGPGDKPYLDLSAGDKWMAAPSVSIVSNFTLFMVFAGQTAAPVSAARILEFNNATQANQGRVRFTASGWGMYAGPSATATSGPQSANGSYVQGGWIVSAMRWQNAANANLIHNGTVRTGANDMTPVTPTGMSLASSTTGSNRSQIYVAELLVYNAAISNTDEQTVLAYLNSKYGGVY